MAIQVGDTLPEAKFRVMTAEGPQVKTRPTTLFKGKKVALFAVPGAYHRRPAHKMHLPGICRSTRDAIKDKGVEHDRACVSVNDAFVMGAWERDTDQRRRRSRMLADGNADFTKAIGMELDASGNGLGMRSQALFDAGGRRRGRRSSTSSRRPARSRFPAAIRCWGSCKHISAASRDIFFPSPLVGEGVAEGDG